MTESTTGPATPPAAATIFNGYVLAHALFALWELDLLGRLGDPDGLASATVTAAGPGAAALLDPLVAAGLAARSDGGWHATPAGADVIGEVGFFVWSVGGYGRVFRHGSGISSGRLSYGRDIRRDDAMVVTGSALAMRRHLAPQVQGIVAELRRGAGLRQVLDIGCGNARFLIELCRRYPEFSGVGVDISAAACALAEENVRAAGLAGRIRVLRADFRDAAGSDSASGTAATPVSAPASAAAEDPGTGLVTSFFMLHDLMADAERTVRDLRTLRDRLPATARLLFADTVRREPGGDSELPIFSLGFHLAHALMGVRLWSTKDYDEVFAAAGLVVERRVETSIPSTWLYLLR